MRQYESIIIINSSLNEDTLNRIVNRCVTIIEKQGGKLVEIEKWGKRRLAYPIKKFQYGYYIIFHIEAPSDLISILEREYRMNEHILRFMTLAKTKQALRAYEKAKAMAAEATVKSEASAEKAEESAEIAEISETPADIDDKTDSDTDVQPDITEEPSVVEEEIVETEIVEAEVVEEEIVEEEIVEAEVVEAEEPATDDAAEIAEKTEDSEEVSEAPETTADDESAGTEEKSETTADDESAGTEEKSETTADDESAGTEEKSETTG